MMYDVGLIDVSNFFHRSFHVANSIVKDDPKKMISKSIEISITMLKKLEREYFDKDSILYFLFDNTHSGENKRKLIDPDYKLNRLRADSTFIKCLDLFHLILMSYKNNNFVVKRPGSEADDLVSPIVEKYKDKKVLLISNDIDWFRSINKNVHVAKYENKEYVIYNEETFIDRFQFSPSVEAISIYKSFRGDSSDNIPKGVSGIREASIISMIEENDSLINILKDIDNKEYLTEKWKEKIKENIPRILLNYKLVSFDPISMKEINQHTYKTEFSPQSLKTLYSTLNLKISKLDIRLSSMFPDKQEKTSFFEFEKIPRM